MKFQPRNLRGRLIIEQAYGASAAVHRVPPKPPQIPQPEGLVEGRAVPHGGREGSRQRAVLGIESPVRAGGRNADRVGSALRSRRSVGLLPFMASPTGPVQAAGVERLHLRFRLADSRLPLAAT